MTQRENIREAIKYLRLGVDTFPDKDDKIRRNNDAIEGMISMLKIIICELSYDID